MRSSSGLRFAFGSHVVSLSGVSIGWGMAWTKEHNVGRYSRLRPLKAGIPRETCASKETWITYSPIEGCGVRVNQSSRRRQLWLSLKWAKWSWSTLHFFVMATASHAFFFSLVGQVSRQVKVKITRFRFIDFIAQLWNSCLTVFIQVVSVC